MAAESDRSPLGASGERSRPMSLKELARRYSPSISPRKFKEIALRYFALERVARSLWIIRLDLMDRYTRKRFED